MGGHFTQMYHGQEAGQRHSESMVHWHYSHGRGSTSRVKIATRLRIMRTTFTTFGRSRAWAKTQIRSLEAVQTYALQRCFGLDKLSLYVPPKHCTKRHNGL